MQHVRYLGKSYQPSKIICIGRNYLAHIEELNNEIPEDLVTFIKPNSAISRKLNSQHLNEALHFEGELVYLYEQGTFTAVAFGLDLTKRALQSKLKEKGLPWEKAKAFDESALLSDFVAIDDIDQTLSLELTIDGEVRQQASTELMMHKPSAILEQVSRWLTLVDGDIVMSGTPKGVGVVESGQQFIGRVIANNQCLVEEIWRSK